LEPNTGFKEAYPDQWSTLKNVERWSEEALNGLISEWGLKRHEKRPGDNGTGNPPGWVAKALEGVSQGARDTTATKLAGYFVEKNVSGDAIEAILNLWNRRNQPPLEGHEIRKIVSSVSRYQGIGDPQNERIRVSFVGSQGSG
jgi:hypothetical protein